MRNVSVITGGGSGIGFAIAKNMPKENVIVICGRTEKRLEKACEELAAEGYDLKALSRELGMHEFRIKKAMAAANRLSLDKLKATLMQLYETDTQIKQGNIDGTLALELIIGRI